MAPPKPPQRDFAKRPKAKVGKRAPSKINSTDTSFQTASVAIRSQEGALAKNNSYNKQQQQQSQQNQLLLQDKEAAASAAARIELASSRGNALSTLQLSLRHHAPAVRSSGLKGIRDAVQSLSSLDFGVSILEANLPSLIPNMCRCWLDEDDDVRGLALNLFGDMIKVLSSSSSATLAEGDSLRCMVPFVPFLCAYTSSAMNSLDRSIRKDGASIVGMMASSNASPSFAVLSSMERDGIMSSMAMETGRHVDLFLPSLERLLSSMTVGGGGRGGGGGGGRNNGDSATGKSGGGVGKDDASGAKKRKRDGKSGAQPSSSGAVVGSSRSTLAASDSVLLSIAFLLRASLASSTGDGSSSNGTNAIDLIRGNSGNLKRRLDPSLFVSGECTFLRGGSAHANSLLIFREMQRNQNESSLKPIHSILDLPPMPMDQLTNDAENSYAHEAILVAMGGGGGGGGTDSSNSKEDAATMEKIQKITSLLETLRMKFVELTHSGNRSNEDQVGLVLSSADVETLDVLVTAVRFSHRRFQTFQGLEKLYRMQMESSTASTANQKRQRKGVKKSNTEVQGPEQYQIISNKILTLLLENFPIRATDNLSSQTWITSRYELSNAGICSALAELGGDSMAERIGGISTPLWVDTVFSYIFPRLANQSNDLDLTMEGEEVAVVEEGSEVVATHMLLKVVRKLLLPNGFDQSSRNYLLNNPLKRHELLEAFAGAFFPRLAYPSGFKDKEHSSGVIYVPSSTDDAQRHVEQFASSTAGRSAVILLTSLIAQMGDEVASDDEISLHEKGDVLLLQMASVLPIYLASWKGTFPIESGLVLASITSIVRQWSTLDNGADVACEGMATSKALSDVCLGLRCSMDALFVQNSITRESSSKKILKAHERSSSIFERLPEQVQKLAVGLIGMLKCPTESLAKSLSIICSKTCIPNNTMPVDSEEVAIISSSMANYIMEVMHSLRRTMPMSMYLTFLLDSSGIQRTVGVKLIQQRTNQTKVTRDDDNGPDRNPDCIFLFDNAIEQLSRFLTSSCEEASVKVLPMVRPIIEKWLSASTGALDHHKAKKAKSKHESSSFTNDITKRMIHARAAISILAAFTWDEVVSFSTIENDSQGFICADFLKLDVKFDTLILDSILHLCDLSTVLWSAGGGQFDDSMTQQQFLARLLGPVTLIFRYRGGMLQSYLQEVPKRITRHSDSQKQDFSTLTNEKKDESVIYGNGTDMAEVHMSALLLVLKSKEPASISSLIKRSEDLQKSLSLATAEIEHIVSGGHLAHLGGKLQHQAKMICDHGVSN